ncbi:MAG: T9SS type A sorting domain-containing protein [Cyclobacteriaceae bacterium]|nr:T9SS type A sorting domain-containing protein [Cyclobacteriaceae bacterium]
MKRIGVLFFAVMGYASLTSAQQLMSISPKKPVICYLDAKNKNTVIPPPAAYLKAKANPQARTATATFEVEYVGFSTEAQAAFQEAVNIWSTLIQSPVKIKIKAFWRPLGTNVLGSAIWGTALANFPNAQKLNTFYPVALAEKIAGKELNHPDSADIFANFSSTTAWYYGTSGTPPVNTTDLVSVVLHEIGHGLGFTDSYDGEGGTGSHGVQSSTVPIIFDLAIENGATQNLFQTFTSPSTELGAQLVSGNIFYNSPLAKAANGNALPRLYAPSAWDIGSSIAHLNESTYSSGTANSLMTPQIGFREVIHDPGSIVLGMFSDMGWVTTRIEHTPTNKESFGATTLIAKINSDNGFDAAKVKLKYIKKSGGAETTITGTANGNTNEFSFNIPASAGNDTIVYYFTATDVLDREYTNPGKFARAKNTELQGRFTIGLGADVTAPVIAHTPKTFFSETETQLIIDAAVSDNIGIQNVVVDYWINNTQQTSVPMNQVGAIDTNDGLLTATYSTNFAATIPFASGSVKSGDVVSYRIRSTDNSAGQNVGYSPTSTTKHILNVVGFSAAQANYQNNFDNLSAADFFGDSQFSITTPSGFTNGAIHTVHPYANAPQDTKVDLVYFLRKPIKLNSQNPIISFDEIVLVEPGDAGTVFGDDKFWDYVIVEGSKDGGVTWKLFENGYDCRLNSVWETKWNSSKDANSNSLASGDPTLYRSHTINMLASNNFASNDEVAIRFRINIDEGSFGWGWAIDNLKIQIDEAPPTVLHNHFNYTTDKSIPLAIAMKVSDISGLKSLAVEYKVNSGTVSSGTIPVNANASDYTFNLGIADASVGDDVQYRIRAIDNLNNEVVVPATDFFHVPIITLASPVAQYTTDFNSANTDFVGNFYSISTPSGFSNGTLNSSHPYPNGFGLTNSKSDYIMMLKIPITISSTNPNMLFDEMAIIEPLNDYAVVEGSKDNGLTWKSLVSEYSANSQSAWSIAYSSKLSGAPAMFKSRFINLTQNGNFKAGDQILIRFRMNANPTNNSWGWAIDNLSIQGPITGVEKALLANSFSIYPNPSNGNSIKVELTSESGLPVRLQVLNSQGQSVQSDEIAPVDKLIQHEYNASNWANGVYLLKAEVNGVVATKKFIKTE